MGLAGTTRDTHRSARMGVLLGVIRVPRAAVGVDLKSRRVAGRRACVIRTVTRSYRSSLTSCLPELRGVQSIEGRRTPGDCPTALGAVRSWHARRRTPMRHLLPPLALL